ncbi:hypothetical protein FQR65_LT17677 [Abscondita terminalis]|nr:hypothetical protein FQR65_LT17677 [Abscondita terminalis]
MIRGGARVAVPAVHFDGKNDDSWSFSIFGDQCRSAKCFGTVQKLFKTTNVALVKWDIDKNTTKIPIDALEIQLELNRLIETVKRLENKMKSDDLQVIVMQERILTFFDKQFGIVSSAQNVREDEDPRREFTRKFSLSLDTVDAINEFNKELRDNADYAKYMQRILDGKNPKQNYSKVNILKHARQANAAFEKKRKCPSITSQCSAVSINVDAAFREEYFNNNSKSLEWEVGVDENMPPASCDSGIRDVIITENLLNIMGFLDEKVSWSRRKTLFLLECLQERKKMLRDLKVMKTTIWKEIAQAMCKNNFPANDSMVERKFRNMKNTHKAIKDNKHKKSTGGGQVTWEYYPAMESLFADDKTMNVGHTIASLPSNITELHLSVPSPSTVTTQSQCVPVPSLPSTSTQSTSYTQISGSTPLTPVQEALPIPMSSSMPLKKEKAKRGQQLHGLRKKQLEIEEKRLAEIKELKEAINKINEIQKERNELFA